MSKFLVSSLLTLGLSAACTSQGAANPSDANPNEAATGRVDPKTAVAQGAVLIDVRNQDEWDAGHDERATLVPLPELGGRIQDVEALVGGDKKKPIVVVCRSGTRSERARKILEQNGFTTVLNGGSWQSVR